MEHRWDNTQAQIRRVAKPRTQIGLREVWALPSKDEMHWAEQAKLESQRLKVDNAPNPAHKRVAMFKLVTMENELFRSYGMEYLVKPVPPC